MLDRLWNIDGSYIYFRVVSKSMYPQHSGKQYRTNGPLSKIIFPPFFSGFTYNNRKWCCMEQVALLHIAKEF